jgi:hypothetical protein
MRIVSICELLGWDYFQYMNQPTWFIDYLQDKLDIDSEKIKNEKRKLKHA